MSLSANQISTARKAFFSDLCWCGRDKKKPSAFCKPCYEQLSRESRQALWRKMGQGFEEAFYEAAGELGLDEPGAVDKADAPARTPGMPPRGFDRPLGGRG